MMLLVIMQINTTIQLSLCLGKFHLKATCNRHTKRVSTNTKRKYLIITFYLKAKSVFVDPNCVARLAQNIQVDHFPESGNQM
jgi:hypothetical protein